MPFDCLGGDDFTVVAVPEDSIGAGFLSECYDNIPSYSYNLFKSY